MEGSDPPLFKSMILKICPKMFEKGHFPVSASQSLKNVVQNFIGATPIDPLTSRIPNAPLINSTIKLITGKDS